jgi:hypothetical protein
MLDQETVREAILRKLKDEGITHYQFANHGEHGMAKTTVYRFFNGEGKVRVESLEQLLVAAGLGELRVTGKAKIKESLE